MKITPVILLTFVDLVNFNGESDILLKLIFIKNIIKYDTIIYKSYAFIYVNK